MRLKELFKLLAYNERVTYSIYKANSPRAYMRGTLKEIVKDDRFKDIEDMKVTLLAPLVEHLMVYVTPEAAKTDEVKPDAGDPVNHPAHYTRNGIECIEAIKAALTPQEFIGYLKGNVIKYIWRHWYKGKPLEDLNKATWYMARLVQEVSVWLKKE